MGLYNTASVRPNFNTNATFGSKPFEASAAGSAYAASVESSTKIKGIDQFLKEVSAQRGAEMKDGGAVGMSANGGGLLGGAIKLAAGVAATAVLPGAAGAFVAAGLAVSEASNFISQKVDNAFAEYEGRSSFNYGSSTDDASGGFQPMTDYERASLDNYQCATGEVYTNGWAQPQNQVAPMLMANAMRPSLDAADRMEEKVLGQVQETLLQQRDELAVQGDRAANFAKLNNETVTGFADGPPKPVGLGAPSFSM